MNRDKVFEALAGDKARNFPVKDDSDFEIRSYVCPSFSDLYDGNVYRSEVTKWKDPSVSFDIRNLEVALLKGGITDLELLYSPEINTFGMEEMEELVNMRDDIVRMDLPKYHETNLATFKNYVMRMGDIGKNPPPSVKALGYDPKKLVMAVYHAMGIVAFEKQGFAGFRKLCRFKTGSKEYNFFKECLEGKVFYADKLVREMEFKLMFTSYHSKPVNQETVNKVRKLFRSLVARGIKAHLDREN